MWSALRSIFIAARPEPIDPREPDCPRTPIALWTRANATLDPRSPSLGVARSPLRSRIERVPFAPRANVARLSEDAAASDAAADSSTFEFRSLAAGNELSPEPARAAPAPVLAPVPQASAAVTAPVNVDEELAKLRLEFSTKKAKQELYEAPDTPASEAKVFLSSPALWRTIAQSSPAFVGVKTPEAQALLQRPAWESPHMRRALFRHDSASAA